MAKQPKDFSKISQSSSEECQDAWKKMNMENQHKMTHYMKDIGLDPTLGFSLFNVEEVTRTFHQSLQRWSESSSEDVLKSFSHTKKK